MTARNQCFSAMTRSLVCSVALMALGVMWGCGGGTASQAALDEAAEARVQEAKNATKKAMEKRQAARGASKGARPSPGAARGGLPAR
jgi:hypothetical protein